MCGELSQGRKEERGSSMMGLGKTGGEKWGGVGWEVVARQGNHLGSQGEAAISQGHALQGGGHSPCEAIQRIGCQLQSLLA